MTSIIKYIYNLYKKLNAGCNSTEVLNSVEKQKDEIIVSLTSDVQEINETIDDRTRANTMYEEPKTSINENVEQFVSQGIDVIDAIHTTLTEVPLESAPEPVVEPIPDSTEESIKETTEESIKETTEESIKETTEESIKETIEEPIQEPANEPIKESIPEPIPEPIQEDQQSEYSSIHSPPPSPEYDYTENQTEIIGVVVDTDDSSIIKPSYNKFI
jgi:hypothetical protein